jgi:hypothetical protein
MAKQLKLKEDEETGMIILGIISQENDLKVSWAINKGLGLKFARINNIVYTKSLNQEGFPVYSFDDEKNQVKYNLVINKSLGFNFIPSLKNVDFILFLKGNVNESDTNSFITRLKQLTEIAAVVQVDPDKIKERDAISLFWQ